jgi:hypothetical protein
VREIIGQLDTPGGHILCCLVLILLGAGLWKLGVPKSDDLIIGATGVLFGSMRGRGGSGPEKDVLNGPPAVAPRNPSTVL